MLSLQWGLDFLGSGGPSWEPTSIKNRSKNEVKMGRQLGIDFSSILVDFGTQVGKPNRTKRGPKQDKTREGRTRRDQGRQRQKDMARPAPARFPDHSGGVGGFYLPLKGGTALDNPPVS